MAPRCFGGVLSMLPSAFSFRAMHPLTLLWLAQVPVCNKVVRMSIACFVLHVPWLAWLLALLIV